MANESRAGDLEQHDVAAGSRVFYGWYIVGSVFLISLIFSSAIYSFGSFYTTLADTFGVSRAAVSSLFGLTLALLFLSCAVAGRIADRVGPRPMVIAGSGLFGAGLLVASRASSFWQVCAAFAIGAGVGSACMYITGIELVDRWFVRRRGFATGLAVGGAGAGTLVGPPLAALLISLVHWRATMAIFGLIAIVTIPVLTLALVPSPQDRGLLPDGDRADAQTNAAAPAAGSTLGEALRSRTFWLLYASTALCALGMFIPFAQLLPFARDHNISHGLAAIVLGLIGAGNLSGRMLLGSLTDRIGRKRSFAFSMAGLALAMGWWLVATSAVPLAVFAVGFGLCYGVFFALIGALAADYFGVRSAGAIIGVLLTAVAPGSLLGPVLSGAAFDAYNSYTLPIAVGALFCGAALACVLILEDPAHPHPVRHRPAF